MVPCLICKKMIEIVKNHVEQKKIIKTGNTNFLCPSCQAKILYEAKKKVKEG